MRNTAQLNEIKGNSIVWNQLATFNSSRTDKLTNYGLTAVALNDHEISVSGTSNQK